MVYFPIIIYTYDYSSGKVIYTPSKSPNAFESSIGNIVNSEKSVNLELTSENRQVLVGDWNLRAIDLGDLKGMESHGFDPSRVMLHETVEQFNLDWNEINTMKAEYKKAKDNKDWVSKALYVDMINKQINNAHNIALGAESRCFELGGIPTNDIIPYRINANSGTFVVREVGGKIYMMPYIKRNIK